MAQDRSSYTQHRTLASKSSAIRLPLLSNARYERGGASASLDLQRESLQQESPRVTTRICRRSPLCRAPRRLLASLSRGANYSPFGGRKQSVAAELANEAASV